MYGAAVMLTIATPTTTLIDSESSKNVHFYLLVTATTMVFQNKLLQEFVHHFFLLIQRTLTLIIHKVLHQLLQLAVMRGVASAVCHPAWARGRWPGNVYRELILLAMFLQAYLLVDYYYGISLLFQSAYHLQPILLIGHRLEA